MLLLMHLELSLKRLQLQRKPLKVRRLKPELLEEFLEFLEQHWQLILYRLEALELELLKLKRLSLPSTLNRPTSPPRSGSGGRRADHSLLITTTTDHRGRGRRVEDKASSAAAVLGVLLEDQLNRRRRRRRRRRRVIEVTIDRRFTDLVYYCALELADTSSTGVKQYKSNTVSRFERLLVDVFSGKICVSTSSSRTFWSMSSGEYWAPQLRMATFSKFSKSIAGYSGMRKTTGNPKSHNSSSFEPSPSQATSRTGTTASGIPSGLPRKNIFGWRGKNPPL
ncbi:hypothetical protein TYRP_016973 [Tyrophagus putrescentiae]|nr:hypothetical protein TYRP_016973 [Tyrophagus putrescentiae]